MQIFCRLHYWIQLKYYLDIVLSYTTIIFILFQYRHIIGLGAVKLRDFIYTAIQQIMSDELVNKFTWLGDKSSKQLADTKMMNIIYCKWFYCRDFE